MATFNFEGLLSKTLNIYQRNLVPILVVAVLLNIPSYGLSLYLENNAKLNAVFLFTTVLSICYFLVQTSLLSGYIVSRVTEHGLEQYKSRLNWPTLSLDMQWILPLITMTCAMALLGSLGMLLFVIPGIIMLLAWSYSVPVMLLEQKYDVREALTRSWQMTSGERWNILTIFIILGLAQWLVQIGVDFLCSLLFGAGTLSTVIAAGVNIAMAPIGSILIIVLYLRRRLQEEETTSAP